MNDVRDRTGVPPHVREAFLRQRALERWETVSALGRSLVLDPDRPAEASRELARLALPWNRRRPLVHLRRVSAEFVAAHRNESERRTLWACAGSSCPHLPRTREA